MPEDERPVTDIENRGEAVITMESRLVIEMERRGQKTRLAEEERPVIEMERRGRKDDG